VHITTQPESFDQPAIEAFVVEDAPEEGDDTLEATERPSGKADAVVTVWHGLDETGVLALGDIILAFQRQVPGTQVNLFYIPFDDLNDRYVSAVNSGNGPSLMLGAGEWGPALYDLDAIADMADFTPPELRSEFSPPALEAATYQDSLIGLPFAIRGVVLYRNRAIITETPSTYEELVTVSQEAAKGRIIGAYLERGDLFAFSQLAACGRTLMYSNGYPAFNNPDGLCWFELLRSFEDAGPVSFNGDDDLNRFRAGSVGVIIDGTWNMEMLSENLGDDLVIDPWPAYKEDHLSGYVWSDNVYLNPDLDDDDKNTAMAFAKYFLLPESQRILADKGQIPATLNLDISEVLMTQSMTALSGGAPFPVLPDIQFYWEPMHAALVSVFEGGVEPSVALKTASDAITGSVEDYRDLEDDF
jgi:arabinogalactan oligomer/maltooligosaccharide transport system substrate-binding protein